MTDQAIAWHLSPMTPVDCEAVWHIANDPVVRANALNPDPIPWKTHQAWFANRLADPGSLFLAVRTLESGTLIGQVRFEARESPPNAWQLHYGLAAAVRGKGLARAVVLAALEILRHERVCQSVCAIVLEHNEASQRVLGGAGFKQLMVFKEETGQQCWVWRADEWGLAMSERNDDATHC